MRPHTTTRVVPAHRSWRKAHSATKTQRSQKNKQLKKYTKNNKIQIEVFQLVGSVAQSYPTLWNPMNCSTPGLPVQNQLPEFTQTHVHWVRDAIQPSHPLLSPLLMPSIFPNIRVFSNESVVRIKWPNYRSFSISISPSNEYSGFISFRTDRFDLLAVQGNLNSLLQHHSSKASILCNSAFFMFQLSHRYMNTGKAIALTLQTFVSKVVSLLCDLLSRFVIAFLPRSKHLLISWLL